MSSEWFIMRVDSHKGYLEWPQHELPISPAQAALGAMPEALVDSLRGATPEEMQEIADAVFLLRRCSQLRLQTRRWEDEDGETRVSWWGWVMGVPAENYDTRREALHALAEAVKGVKDA